MEIKEYLWKTQGTINYKVPLKFVLNKELLIASFDLYGTLIEGNSGEEFPSFPDNWIWTNPLIPKFLNETYKSGFQIVIFSNLKNNKTLDRSQYHVDTLSKELTFQPFVFFSFAPRDKNSKPNTGMWDFFLELTNSTASKASFYCGNSEGPEAKNPLYRGASTDSTFAKNIGLAFYNPDEMFPQYIPNIKPTENSRELIITVGQPGSGKTTFSNKFAGEHSYDVIARPKQGFKTVKGKKVEKHLDMIRDVFKQGTLGIIYDATNPSVESRATTIEVGKEMGARIIVWWFARPGQEFNKLRAEPIPRQGLERYTKNFQEPTLTEGIDEIVRIN